MLKFICFLLVIAVVFGEKAAIPFDKALRFQPISKDGASWALNGNKLVDAIILNIKSQFPDSLPLKEIHKTYTTKLWLAKIHGTYHLWNGKVWGLQSVHRTGDVKIIYLDNTKTLIIKVALGARQLWASYMGHGEMKPITIDPRIQATIPNLAISAKICASVANSVQLRVCGVKISSGQPKISFHGLHMFNGLADVLSNMFLRKMKPKLIEGAEKNLRKKLKNYLDHNEKSLKEQIQAILHSKIA